jgi:ABC-2 type transport system permease protein
MLWQKSWWETRWGLLTFMVVVLLFAVWRQPWEQADLTRWASALQRISGRSEDSTGLLPLLSTYQGYMWSYWFKTMLLIMWPLYAIVIGWTLVTASCPWVANEPGGSGLFTFSLPVSRRRVLLTHAAVVAVEIVLVALLPSLIFPIASRLIGGGEVSFGSTVVHALLFSLGGMVFPAFSYLLTAVFSNPWKMLAIGIAVVIALVLPPRGVEEFPRWNVFHLMSGETYFRYGQIPWLELLTWLAIAAAILLLAVRIYERRDF